MELDARVVTAHREACERGDAGYMDPLSGLFVMTEVYLVQRERCCNRGCRHCPYPKDK
ncbi:MAG: DUF5522 domain-containing protein [Actinomycetes bacterium]